MNKAMIGAVVGALAVSACAQAGLEPAPILNLPNPASAYCMQIGGELRIETSPQGERGICVLPDGTQIEEWELYRRDQQQK